MSILTLEDHLELVNYKDYNDYIPSEFALKMVNFIKLCTDGRGEEHKTPVIHYKMLDKYASKKELNLNLCARGLAKTTLMKYLFLYIAVYGKIDNFGNVDYALYVADSIENNVKAMRRALELAWDNSKFLRTYIPKTNFTDVEWQFENREGKKFIVTAHGALSGIRGTTRLNTRPQLAVLDDLIKDDADARSAVIMSGIENTVYKSVMHALHPTKRKIIWSGTPFNQADPLYKAIASGVWNVSVFPICEYFDEATPQDVFYGAWEDRFGYKAVKDSYLAAKGAGKIDAFNQELMLRLMSDEDRLVLDDDIMWYQRKAVTQAKDRYHFYITTDFATSESQSSDYSVISVWAYDANGDWLWVDGTVARQLMDQNIEDLFRFVKIYKPLLVGVEISGQQKGFVSWLKSEMINRNTYFNFARNSGSSQDGLRPTTNKMVRFQPVISMFKLKKIFFPSELKDTPQMKEAINELSHASLGGFRSKHDDFIDTVSMLSDIDAIKPEPIDEKPQKQEYNYFSDGDSDLEQPLTKNKSVVF